jgi:hypothetical protein
MLHGQATGAAQPQAPGVGSQTQSGSGAAHTAQTPSQLSCVVGWGCPAHTRVGLPRTHSHALMRRGL